MGSSGYSRQLAAGNRVAGVVKDDSLVLTIDCEAAKHVASLGRQRRDRVEHELMRDRLTLLDV